MARARKRCTCCNRKAKTRKMCNRCRGDAKWLMDNGYATEADLIGAELLAPKKPLGRPAAGKKESQAKSLEDNAVWRQLQKLSVGTR